MIWIKLRRGCRSGAITLEKFPDFSRGFEFRPFPTQGLGILVEQMANTKPRSVKPNQFHWRLAAGIRQDCSMSGMQHAAIVALKERAFVALGAAHGIFRENRQRR